MTRTTLLRSTTASLLGKHYGVDRRVVIDQATSETERIAAALARDDATASELRTGRGLRPEQNLLISTLRGAAPMIGMGPGRRSTCDRGWHDRYDQFL
jgi:hypothetical protein